MVTVDRMGYRAAVLAGFALAMTVGVWAQSTSARNRQFPKQHNAGDDARGPGTCTGSGKHAGRRHANEPGRELNDADRGTAGCRHDASWRRCAGSGQAAGYGNGVHYEWQWNDSRG